MAAQTHRTPAAEKRPEDFATPTLPKVEKRFADLVITRASGEVNTTRLVLRPGDVVTLDDKTILEG